MRKCAPRLGLWLLALGLLAAPAVPAAAQGATFLYAQTQMSFTTTQALNDPGGVAVDGNGNVYIADSHNAAVWQVSPGGSVTRMGNNTPDPISVAVDGIGNLYIGDTNQGVLEVPYGKATTQNTLVPAAFGAKFPIVAADAAGDVFFIDSPLTANLYELSASSIQNSSSTPPTPFLLTSDLYVPFGLAVDSSSKNLYVTNNVPGNGFLPGVVKISLSSTPTEVSPVPLDIPWLDGGTFIDLVVDQNQNIYVTTCSLDPLTLALDIKNGTLSPPPAGNLVRISGKYRWGVRARRP